MTVAVSSLDDEEPSFATYGHGSVRAVMPMTGQPAGDAPILIRVKEGGGRMSQYYRADDIVLWNPSSGVSRVFLGQVRIFEAELSLASGVGPMEADECRVEVEEFRTFAQALLTYCEASNHQMLRTLTDGFVVTVLALAERAGAEVRQSRVDGPQHDVQVGSGQTLSGETGDELRQRAHAMLRFMPR